MKKKIKNLITDKTSLLIILSFYMTIFCFDIKAQTISVHGKVASSRYAVKEALVTFIDNADTTKKFSALTDDLGNYQIGVPTSVGYNKKNFPDKFELVQNYPNPFSSSTAIPYNLNKQSAIKVTIYDILGREVRKFSVGDQTPGSYNILWDGRNNFGQKVANGVYFYKLNAGSEFQVKKMILSSGGKNLISLSQINFSPKLSSGKEINKSSADNNYTIRIENSENTSPTIISKQFDNIQVNNDTTINFTVDHLASVTIDFDSLHQIIRGFGAANILLWRPDMTNSEIETAFGMGEDQLGFSILRIMLEADSSRWSNYISTAKKAYDMGATIIASPWFAPDELSEDIGNINRVRYDMYNEYAEHLNSFNSYMANNGVPIYGISIQNEPDIEENWTSWTSEEMFTFMKDYAYAIEGTNVMAPESFHFDRTYSDPILNDSAANANTDIVCGHIYGSGLGSYPLAVEKGKEVWMTEHLSGEDSEPTNWDWALTAGEEINDVMKAGMNAYIWWYLVRYYGPISDGTYLRKGEVTKKGYVMSQFAKFIRPGYYRIESNVYPPLNNLKVTAYKDSLSSKAVIVATNMGTTSEDVAFTFKDGTINTSIPYTTSEAKNLEQANDITVNGNKVIITLEPSSITTLVSNLKN